MVRNRFCVLNIYEPSSSCKDFTPFHSNELTDIFKEYFVSGFTVILPTLAKELHINQASSTWPASAFSLTTASFLLIFGRLADMYGGYPLYVAGFAWLAVWSLIAGFSTNDIMLNFCRALQGLGPAAFLPAGVMILGSIYRPGPRKNIVFSSKCSRNFFPFSKICQILWN